MDPLPPNFVIVTLGVSDLDRSIAFYAGLGWEQRGDPSQGIAWFRTSGSWVGLFPVADLAADVGLSISEAGTATKSATYAVNLASEAAVDAGFATVRELGARVVKEPTTLEWGGYSGYFEDPDGHLWELCFNPGFPIDDEGRIEIP
ncbi:MAG TPA: VOC family protein [Marmoricola sp.]|nr:VOC family protein [Marmoricola sp.]